MNRRQKQSERMKRRYRDPEERKKQSERTKKLWDDPEHRRKHLKALRTLEYRRDHSETSKKKWQDSKYRVKQREPHLKACRAPEHRRGKSERAKKRWEDSEYREEQLKRLIDRGFFWPKLHSGYRTDIEQIVEVQLQGRGIYYKFNHRVRRYFVDFFLPNVNLGIEADGTYWHSDDDTEYAKKRDEYLESKGLKMIHLPGRKIREDINLLFREEVLPFIGVEV